LATIALVVFALAVTVTLRRGRRIACGCFGDAETVSGRSLARILLLLSGTLVVLAFDSLDRQPISAVWVMHHGAAGVLYVLQIGLVAGSMMLIASWLLRISQVISVIRTSAENAE
jgi:hypothetical protein